MDSGFAVEVSSLPFTMQNVTADPLFILALPHLFTSVVCAMLGQHPRLYEVPQLSSSTAETLGKCWGQMRQGRSFLANGLLRAVAELYFGEQTDDTVERAVRWVEDRLDCKTRDVFVELKDKVELSILIGKSPATLFRPKCLQGLLKTFPSSRFIKRSRRGYPWLQPWGGASLSFLHSMTRRRSFRSNKNVVYSCLYHVVFCPKYRRPVLVVGVAKRLKEIVATTAEAFSAISRRWQCCRTRCSCWLRLTHSSAFTVW
jgi:hypothetical protein